MAINTFFLLKRLCLSKRYTCIKNKNPAMMLMAGSKYYKLILESISAQRFCLQKLLILPLLAFLVQVRQDQRPV